MTLPESAASCCLPAYCRVNSMDKPPSWLFPVNGWPSAGRGQHLQTPNGLQYERGVSPLSVLTILCCAVLLPRKAVALICILIRTRTLASAAAGEGRPTATLRRRNDTVCGPGVRVPSISIPSPAPARLPLPFRRSAFRAIDYIGVGLQLLPLSVSAFQFKHERPFRLL